LETCGPIVNRSSRAQPGFLRFFLKTRHYPLVTTFHVRRLPHYHCNDQPIFLTWRLFGTLPPGRRFLSRLTSGKAFVAMDHLLDNARTGPLYLRQPETARLVVDSIRYRDGETHQLHKYVVMANHVHLLITPRVPVPKLTESLKRFTARECNRILGLTGRPFWQDESYDRLVRNEKEFERIAFYIEMNPVRAGLVATPEDFPWSSAAPVGQDGLVGQDGIAQAGWQPAFSAQRKTGAD
jgi:REP element-mobilizing transposase RayT